MQQEIPNAVRLFIGSPPDLFVTEQVETTLNLWQVILRKVKSRAGYELLADIAHVIWCVAPSSTGQRGKGKEPGQGVRALAISSLPCFSLFPVSSSLLALTSLPLSLYPCLFALDGRCSDTIPPSLTVPAAAYVLLCDRPGALSRPAWPALVDDREAQEDGEWY